MATQVSFEEFRKEWLTNVIEGNPSTTELGRRFARKLIAQWLDLSEDSDDIVYCDGAGDGGIDVAILRRGESGDAEPASEGDTWYLIQSKYGRAFQGDGTLLREAHKVIDTLEGRQLRLSSLAEGLVESLVTFHAQASERDRIVLVFATEEPLTEAQRRTLEDIKAMGNQRLGALFDVDAVSIETIYQRTLEEPTPAYILVPIKASVASSGPDLLVGSVSLLNLYDFMKSYRSHTQDLDRLYEKNVRRFLGSRGRVNRAMQETLRDTPERFGLYNNGITIVVADFQTEDTGEVALLDPYIVNGCQTTRTIWDVCHQRLDAGGTGKSPKLEEWRHRASGGVVVTKIVRVGTSGDEALANITRYTNNQNAVRAKDFLALTKDFRTWAEQMGARYGIFLEVQRGGWDSRRALQRQNPGMKPQFARHANAFGLLKVYGAGWLQEAGTAFGRNDPFLPNGAIFKQIMGGEDGIAEFGVDDLYAAYLLQLAADSYQFGRNAAKPSRRTTRFLFYMVALELLKDVIVRANMDPAPEPKVMTRALLTLFSKGNDEAQQALLNAAVELVDEYLTQGVDDCVFAEPAYQQRYNSDLNTYFKWEQFGKSEQSSPRLRSLLAIHKAAFGRGSTNHPSPRQLVAESIMQRVAV